MSFLAALRNLFRKREADRELDAEVHAHLDLLEEEKRRAGLTSALARRAARLELGGVEQVKEEVRRVRAGAWLDSFFQDLRYAARQLRRNPGFAAVAVLTLGLAIGANTAIFSVFDAVLLRSLPLADEERVIMVFNRGPAAAGGDRMPLAVADLLDWRAQSHSFSEIGAYSRDTFNFTGRDLPERIHAARVTANFFSVIGVRPTLGRAFVAGEDKPGAERVVLLSDAFWRTRFAADPLVIGRTITLDGAPLTVIGVAPAGLEFPSKDVSVWTPLELKPPTRRGPYYLAGVARLKPGVSLAAARADVSALNSSFPSGQHILNEDRIVFSVLPVTEFVVGDVRLVLVVLLAAVTLVLLIAAVDIANLMLVRSAARVKEISLRAALGAGRGRIVRQLLTESMLLAFASGAAGVLLAVVGVRLLLKLAPETLPRLSQVGIDARVLAWTALVSVLTGLVFGLAPAWQSARLSLDEALKESGRGTSEGSGKRRWRSLLVVTELALAVMLLVGAGLLIKSFRRLQEVDSGVSTDRVLTMQIPLRGPNYAKKEQLDAFYPRLLERIESLPGVRSAAVSNSLPPDTNEYSDDFKVEGRPQSPGAPPLVAYMVLVSPDFFRTFGIHLLRGRLLSLSDAPSAPLVAVISETTARQFFPNEDAVGKRLNNGDPIEIVGVVSDVKYTGLAGPTQPVIYQAMSQQHSWDAFLSVKTNTAEPMSLAATMRGALRAIDPEVPIVGLATLDMRFETAVEQPRFRTTLIALFAGLALLLAVIGTYGVISYSVSQRSQEIGIRLALGAQTREVLAMVLKEGAALAVAGVFIGLCGSFALTGLMRSLLFDVSTTDWTVFGAGALLLGLTALLACYLPARRAATVDPMIALRHE